MNFLAHCYLADDSAESLIGNLAPDFLRGCEYQPQPPQIISGMQRHRFVDEFTDSHPCFLKSRALFAPKFRHAAGMIVDVAYDHELAKNWSEYSREPLGIFVQRVYAQLHSHAHLCPPELQEAFPRMREQNWLESYATIEGIRLTLSRMAARMKRDIGLPDAADILALHSKEIERDFSLFFGELNAAIKKS